MAKYNRYEVTKEHYERIASNFKKEGTNKSFSEQRFGTRKSLYFNGTLVATCKIESSLELGDLSNKKFSAFLATFSKNLYSQFSKKPELFNLKLQLTNSSRKKRIDIWDKMKVGRYFYNLDLKSAYWQIAYRLGYISEKMFKSYQTQDAYKQAKRYCISFLARPNKMTYVLPPNYKLSRYEETKTEIVCNTEVFQTVYDNIRYELYDCIGKSFEGVEDVLEYNIDGVSVFSKDLDLVKKRFMDMGLIFKITECRKISDTEYTSGSKIKKFKRVHETNQTNKDEKNNN